MIKKTAMDGRGRASIMSPGVIHSDVDRVRLEYARLNTDEAKGAFADKLIRSMASRLNDTWPILYHLLAIIRDRKVFEMPELVEGGRACPDFKTYFEEVVGRPFDTWGEMEQVHHFVSEFKPELLRGSYEEAQKGAREIKTLLDALNNKAPLGNHGGIREAIQAVREMLEEPDQASEPDAGQGSKSGNQNLAQTEHRGTTSAYRIRKLRRDHPTVAARLDAGEFKSVAAAERAARGLEPNPPRRMPTPYENLLRAWALASAEEKDRFMTRVNEEGW